MTDDYTNQATLSYLASQSRRLPTGTIKNIHYKQTNQSFDFI
jgi:hypothetical protein